MIVVFVSREELADKEDKNEVDKDKETNKELYQIFNSISFGIMRTLKKVLRTTFMFRKENWSFYEFLHIHDYLEIIKFQDYSYLQK